MHNHQDLIDFHKNLQVFQEKIEQLPTTEAKYWLQLLHIGIRTNDTGYNREILQKSLIFTTSFQHLCDMQQQDDLQMLYEGRDVATTALENLLNTAKTNTLSVACIQVFLNVLGVIMALIAGLAGAALGAVGGSVRGFWNSPSHVMEYLFLGIAVGFFCGGMLGFRTPKKLFKDPVFRQLKFALDGLSSTFYRQIDHTQLPIVQAREVARKYLLEEYFDKDPYKLQQFLKGHVVYDINTQLAEFLHPTNAGYLGQHFYIAASINKKMLGLEFTWDASEFNKKAVQSERRIVSGEVFLEMLAFNEVLKSTHTLNTKYIFTTLKSGDRDCKSFVDTLLAGTSQKPTYIERFNNEGRIASMIGFFVTRLSPFPPTLTNERCKTFNPG